MDWSIGEGLYNRFKLWKQQCELLFSGPIVKLEEPIRCKYLLYWSGEWNYSIAGTFRRANRKYYETTLTVLRTNELIAAWELYNIKQATLSLEEFIAKFGRNMTGNVVTLI